MLVKNSKLDEVEMVLEKLQDIKDQEGIMGYILRGSKSASIDLKDPTKIIEYAVLSSTAYDVSKKLTETLQTGEVDNLVVESEDTKFISTSVNDHQVTIFMEKNVDHSKLFKNLK
jgi:predicted regulator of Ras-like GTPase activity (Roadblock/LC7/MglB family)